MSKARMSVKVRVFRSGIGDDDPYPWNLDLMNRVTDDYSDSCWTLKTHQEAIASIPEFLVAAEQDLADLIQRTSS